MNVVLPNGVTIEGIPEGTSKDVIMQKAISAGLATAQDFGIPEDYGDPVVKDGQYQIGGPETLDIGREIIAPPIEAGVTLATGAAGDIAGQLTGGVAAAIEPVRAAVTGEFPDPMAGPSVRDQVAEMTTYQPKTEGGQEIINRYAEIFKPIEEMINKARLGDEALEAGYSEGVARSAEAIPEMVGAAISSPFINTLGRTVKTDKYGNVVSDMSKEAERRMLLKDHPESPEAAQFKLKGDRVVTDKMGKAALNQGWTPETVSGVKASTPQTKTRIRQMVDIARRRLHGGISDRVDLRYTDPLGKSLFERYQFVKQANKSSGKLLDKIARDQKGPVDISEPMAWFQSQLDELGVRVNEKGKIDFSNSELPKSDHGLIKENLGQIRRILEGGVSFYEAHRLKQILRRTGLSYKQTVAKSGASDTTQNLFKGLSGRVDSILDSLSDPYNQQNIKFGETREVLDSIEKIAKDNLFLESGDRFLGKTMRRITSNAVSRDSIAEMVDNIETVANKYGGNFTDDIRTQLFIANEMDDLLGVAAKTSIKGELGAEAMRSVERSTVSNLARTAEGAMNLVRNRNPARALNTLQALTRE